MRAPSLQDPILDAIDHHRRARADYASACTARRGEDALNGLAFAELDAARAFVATTPTTVMGAALALRYVVDVQSEQGDAFTERELTGVIARVADRLFAQPTLAEIG